MISIVIVVLAIIIAVVYFLKSMQTAKPGSQIGLKQIVIAATIIISGIVGAAIQPFLINRVDTGYVGVKVWLSGNNRGVSKYEYKTGWVVINTWISQLKEFPVHQLHVGYPAQEVITKGGFPAIIKPTFNYSIKSGAVGDMYQNLRLDITQLQEEWLKNAIVSAINDVANKWVIDDIFNQREKFEGDIIVEANKRLSKWFIISQLRTNITPPDALKQSIIAKTKATQDVQVAENEKLVAIAQGDKKIAEARADSAASVIEAAGDAEVIRRKQITLTPIYIEYIKAQTWDGKLPNTMLGGNSGALINLK